MGVSEVGVVGVELGGGAEALYSRWKAVATWRGVSERRRAVRGGLMAVGAGSALRRSSVEASSGLWWRVAGTAAAGRWRGR